MPVRVINPRPGSTKLVPRDENLFRVFAKTSYDYISPMQEKWEENKRKLMEEINDKVDRYTYHI